jgi:hypothetical protein
MVMMVFANGRYDKPLSDEINNERAVIGGNNPPEPTPYEAHKANIDDLEAEAKNFLDGEPIANEAQAKAVSKLLDDARKARTAAEAQRKVEAKPFDDGKAAVQALWTPITDEKKGRRALIADTCKKVLAPWLQKLEDEQRAVAEAARREAEEKAAAARKLLEEADAANLQERMAAEAALEDAAKADRAANRAEKARPQAGGGDRRATGLKSVWTPTLTEPSKALRHYVNEQPEELKAWLLSQAQRDVRTGRREIPGFEITEERVPV